MESFTYEPQDDPAISSVEKETELEKERAAIEAKEFEENIISRMRHEMEILISKDKKNGSGESYNYYQSFQEEFPEIEKYVANIISQEMVVRYRSDEVKNRAKKIDERFPLSLVEQDWVRKVFLIKTTKSQIKNIEDMSQIVPRIIFSNWLSEGNPAVYTPQVSVKPRDRDFIEIQVTEPQHLEKPDTFLKSFILHELNHLFTRGEAIFSEGYKNYMSGCFLRKEELEEIAKTPEGSWMQEIPYEGAIKLEEYLKNPAEMSAFLSANARYDLLENGIIENLYGTITIEHVRKLPSLSSIRNTEDGSFLYSKYLQITDHQKLAEWLNMAI